MSTPTPREVWPAVARGALRQARTELRAQMLSINVLGTLIMPSIGLVVMLFLQHQHLGAGVSLGQVGIPGLLTMSLVGTGITGVAGQMMQEREDGTLLRARLTPHGVAAHLLGNVVTAAVTALVPVVLVLVVTSTVFEPATRPGPGAWVGVLGVSALALAAVLPLGAAMGAVARDAMTLGWASILVYGILAISGVFYPITALPGWLQVVGQALPTYWLGIGLRSTLLPDAAASLEITGTWRTLPALVMLVLWTALGFSLALPLLRRMSRRQSGSQVAAARERYISRGY